MGSKPAKRAAAKQPAKKTASSKPAKPLAKPFSKSLAKMMVESLLPGDPPFAVKEAIEAAEFALKAGAKRVKNRSAIALESITGERRMMRIAIVNDDMPFLVDSTSATVAAMGLSIDRLVHPVVAATRNDAGELTDLAPAAKAGAQTESIIYIETNRVDARHRRKLLKALRETLADVRAAVSDWPKVQKKMVADAKAIGASEPESAELLEWLNDGMLTQLGHVTRHRDGNQDGALGICRKSAATLLSDESYARAFDWFERGQGNGKGKKSSAPLIIKANHQALVHRRVPLDVFMLPVREKGLKSGKVTALSVHAGVWTSAALAAPPRDVPKLRKQLDHIMRRLDFDVGGHAGKALVHALTALPHDLLVGFSDSDVERVATTVMGLVDRPRPRLALVEAPLARHLFAFVWLPRDMLATQVRLQIQALLEDAAGATMLDWSLEVEGGNLAMLRFVLDIRDGDTAPDEAAIDRKLQAMLRGWTDAVEAELSETETAGRAAALALRWSEAFPTSYRSEYGAKEAALDIARLRTLGQHADTENACQRDARLCRTRRGGQDALSLKLYQAEGSLPLSDAVPTLENFGFHVESEVPTLLDDGRLGTIHDFHLKLGDNLKIDDVLARAPTIEGAIAAVVNGEAENDVFNRLVPEAALDATEAGWLRAFYRYLRQAGMGFTIYTVVDALSGAPDITRALVTLFRTQHDPQVGKGRGQAAEAARAAIKRGLAQVKAINDDRLLRLYQALIDAVLRTNAFAPAAKEALALKIDSSLVPGLPKPVPWREIFVYSRRVEGIHLRTGAIARGGLRWSDRRDDFRTEILGLMKAQRVKNAVIVPTGAKGGFYPKQLPDPAQDRDGWAAEGQASYEVFIRTLLSVTDNIIEDAVVHPDSVVIHDGEDPYFVVAADKGTARFSDVANGIAESRGFWLDDAFASGGSNGYDHKAMGITARGAWVSVQRHFLEMGVDVQKDPVQVVGCGDMSGDVFGNGMLLSKAIKLVAAFDHRHIFIDPAPDPAKSWKERSRLFNLPRSSWEDYDPKLISKGGGVFARDAKSITLSKAAQTALGIEQKVIEPETLISAIMRSPVDLIWFGGIGTYIKAAHESHAEVGDPANDPVRVNAAEVRAKVVGEGANLGATQAGRIAFALAGGRINTDFIDNSAGVDCSDNEVNIKIALAAARRAGRLTDARRNKLLEEMTDEVAALVLDDNRLQALALSTAELGGPRSMASHVHLIGTLEGSGDLDRQTEGLADDQVLLRRAADGQGLTRPELAVLLSSAKLALQDAIEASPLPDDPSLTPMLIQAFPRPMQGKFKAQIHGHRLRREITATKLANTIINRLGIIHPFELAEEEGVELAQVAAAFVTAEALFDITALWEALERAKMPEKARLLLLDRVAAATGNLMSDVLRSTGGNVAPGELIERLGKAAAVLTKATGELLSQQTRQQSHVLTKSLTDAGAPADMAARVTHLFELDGSVGLAILASDTGLDTKQLTCAFTAVGEHLGLDWAQSTAAMMSPSDVWERLLVDGLARDFQQMRLELVRRLSRRKDAKGDMVASVERWAQRNAASVTQFQAMIARAQTHGTPAPAMLAQIASMARNLLTR
ncbi:NAD-glutamate dehydrogenase [Erythrobacter sp. W53]|uniref:NAD-glutamate dehydrogenase n=1 Tax=Erythrobacter sp. W53 TaxID=3425947 RepID=UPI003D766C63